MPSAHRSTSARAEDEKITLPSIRDILGDELISSPREPVRALGTPFTVEPLRAALSEKSSPVVHSSQRLPSLSPELGLGHRSRSQDRTWGELPSPRNEFSHLARQEPSVPQNLMQTWNRHAATSSRAQDMSSPELLPRRSLPQATVLRRATSAMPMSHVQGYAGSNTFHSKSNSHSGGHIESPAGFQRTYDSDRPNLVSNVNWGGHKRKDSSDSLWSSSSSGASSYLYSPPASNALQFQPLPHSHLASPLSRPLSAIPPDPYPAVAPSANSYQSPFGVLIADSDATGLPPVDPQRMAILRTIRATGSQSSFSVNFDDRNALSSSRYECPYCAKRFSRPSSLKIHINSHTGEKPFQCSHPGCGRRFSVQSNMRRHARVHQQGGQKLGESSGDEEGEGETPRTVQSTTRPRVSSIDMEKAMDLSDDSSSSQAKTAHPSSRQNNHNNKPRK